MENPKTFSVGRLTEVEKHQKRKRGTGQRRTTAHWTQLAERRRLVCRKVGLSIAVLHSATSALTPPPLTSGRACPSQTLCGHVARYTPRATLSAHAVCVVPLAPLVMQTGGFGSDGWRVAAHFPAEAVWSWKESGRRELLRFLVISSASRTEATPISAPNLFASSSCPSPTYSSTLSSTSSAVN